MKVVIREWKSPACVISDPLSQGMSFCGPTGRGSLSIEGLFLAKVFRNCILHLFKFVFCYLPPRISHLDNMEW